ncbi:DUF3883 domain-containing protein [Myroides odoratimimus]|uniref:DUF3883 domain-containing protein n=1 Tax=Myroides odoratimimus TaxID=76832 RepID=UPI0026E0B8BA|nr:DUF3883 domain-containing protein [Myroides odoratimimus]MDO5858619.1 DUF3883 domain-containing protein [Myroides odoratimimus]
MDLEYCEYGNELQASFLKDLHHSQAGNGRHRCATCAYYSGYHLGSSGEYEDYNSFLSLFSDKEQCRDEKSLVPTKFLRGLHENQGGSGRHKCCNCSFIAGFNNGLRLKKEAITINNSVESFVLKQQVVPVLNNEGNLSNSGYSSETPYVVKNFDYINQSSYLRIIGEIGEEIIFEYLNKLPHIISLGEKVEHLSKDLGDGLGYDIMAYDEQGQKLFIEVKTTVKGKYEPFYLSANEYKFLQGNTNAVIYRVYNLDIENKKADFFILNQEHIKQLNYVASSYKVKF